MLIWEKSKGNSRSEPDLLADTTTIKKNKNKKSSGLNKFSPTEMDESV